MARIDLVLETNRFNVSEVRPNFINPGCFGEDFISWLREKLATHGVDVDQIGQEDWGWYLLAQCDPDRYLVGVTGHSAQGAGQWRIMIEKKPAIGKRLFHHSQMADDDRLVSVIEEIVREQKDMRTMRREATP
jgi:hypothetical protein